MPWFCVFSGENCNTTKGTFDEFVKLKAELSARFDSRRVKFFDERYVRIDKHVKS